MTHIPASVYGCRGSACGDDVLFVHIDRLMCICESDFRVKRGSSFVLYAWFSCLCAIALMGTCTHLPALLYYLPYTIGWIFLVQVVYKPFIRDMGSTPTHLLLYPPSWSREACDCYYERKSSSGGSSNSDMFACRYFSKYKHDYLTMFMYAITLYPLQGRVVMMVEISTDICFSAFVVLFSAVYRWMMVVQADSKSIVCSRISVSMNMNLSPFHNRSSHYKRREACTCIYAYTYTRGGCKEPEHGNVDVSLIVYRSLFRDDLINPDNYYNYFVQHMWIACVMAIDSMSESTGPPSSCEPANQVMSGTVLISPYLIHRWIRLVQVSLFRFELTYPANYCYPFVPTMWVEYDVTTALVSVYVDYLDHMSKSTCLSLSFEPANQVMFGSIVISPCLAHRRICLGQMSCGSWVCESDTITSHMNFSSSHIQNNVHIGKIDCDGSFNGYLCNTWWYLTDETFDTCPNVVEHRWSVTTSKCSVKRNRPLCLHWFIEWYGYCGHRLAHLVLIHCIPGSVRVAWVHLLAPTRYCSLWLVFLIIIILSFDIAPFPYKHAQRRITFIVRG